jgi:hypothetical protein
MEESKPAQRSYPGIDDVPSGLRGHHRRRSRDCRLHRAARQGPVNEPTFVDHRTRLSNVLISVRTAFVLEKHTPGLWRQAARLVDKNS